MTLTLPAPASCSDSGAIRVDERARRERIAIGAPGAVLFAGIAALKPPGDAPAATGRHAQAASPVGRDHFSFRGNGDHQRRMGELQVQKYRREGKRWAVALLAAVLTAAAIACSDDDTTPVAGPSPIETPTTTARMSSQAPAPQGGARPNATASAAGTGMNEPFDLMRSLTAAEASKYSPTITSPECGSRVTIRNLDETFNDVTISTSWEMASDITKIYYRVENEGNEIAEGRVTGNTGITLTPVVSWLRSTTEVTLVGESATATYPGGTGPGTKVVFTQVTGRAVAMPESGCIRATSSSSARFNTTGDTTTSGFTVGDRDSVVFVDEESPPLTASFGDIPETHNNAPFTVDVDFTAPITISYRDFDNVWRVTQGYIDRARRRNRQSDKWEIRITPNSGKDVSLLLLPSDGCGDKRDICTEDDTPLTGRLQAEIEHEADTTPLRGEFTSIPTSHGGAAFTADLSFTTTLAISYRNFDHVWDVTGGRATRAHRINGQRELWRIYVTPQGTEDVTLTLPATTSCNASGAICSDGGQPLLEAITATVSR